MKMPKNLTVENVENTEWYNQFGIYQKYEIYDGLERNVDVSIYATPEFDGEQMEEIKLG